MSIVRYRPFFLFDLVHVWHDTRLIVLTAQVAAIYAAILIPFKVGIPLIPGFAELRPANAIPIVASLLFGPVAAWGAGIGNLIGDCFGTLGPASLFGFFGNFFYGYVPYLLWGRLGILSSGREPQVRSWHQGIEFTIVCLTASLVCAGTIAWGVELLGLLPFKILAPAIFFNNIVMGLLLAPPLLHFLYPRVKRWGLRYEDLRGGISHNRFHSLSTSTSSQSTHPESQERQNRDEAFVTVRQATFTYRESSRPALRDLSLTVGRGETVVFMGRSGTGKSTLCYALNGLIPRMISGEWSGTVTVNGHDITQRPVWQQADTVGLVFQDFETQLVSTTVEMEIAYPLEHLERALPTDERQDRIQRTLALVGLTGLEQRDPLTLSGGQRQRLVIASTLVREPSLLVLDQPMTDLDPRGRRQLLSLLDRLKQTGMTVILTEQAPEEALFADRICLFDQGTVQWEGSPHTLFRRSDVAEYGICPLPLPQCFTALPVSILPLTVEEAWRLADETGAMVESSPANLMTTTVDLTPQGHSTTGQGESLVDVHQVSYAYPSGDDALDEVSCSIAEGEFVAIIGQNGSGKSTFAKLLNGLLLPDTGRVMVAGHDTRTTTVGQLAGLVGYVFQNPDHQIFAETVGQEVAFGARNMGCRPDECEQRVAAALQAVGLESPAARELDPFSLTKGERQRVAVASVLAAKPRMLIFDEPTTGLDAEETVRMMQMIHRLNQQGHTILMITHALHLVAEYATRCLVMHEGRLVAGGPTRQMFSNPELFDMAHLEVPSITRFSQRWGYTLLTIEEVRASLRHKW